MVLFKTTTDVRKIHDTFTNVSSAKSHSNNTFSINMGQFTFDELFPKYACPTPFSVPSAKVPVQNTEAYVVISEDDEEDISNSDTDDTTDKSQPNESRVQNINSLHDRTSITKDDV